MILFGCYFRSIWENNYAAPGERIQKSLATVNVFKPKKTTLINEFKTKNKVNCFYFFRFGKNNNFFQYLVSKFFSTFLALVR